MFNVVKNLWNKIREDHLIMMAVCCVLPIIFIGVLFLLGIKNELFYLLALIVCIGSHAFMMLGSKEGKKCH